jgi:hypothetical protein
VKSTNHAAPHYAVFSNLLSLHNQIGIPQDIHGENLRVKQADIYTGVRGDVIEVYE